MSVANTEIPTITSVSPDTGATGDDITDANILTLEGIAEVGDTVQVYDGTILLGAASVNASGDWSFTTPLLADGINVFVATDTNSGGEVSETSSALSVTVQATAPAAPTIATVSGYGAIANGGMNADNVLTLSGTGEANSTVTIDDGAVSLGTAYVNSNGVWSFTTGQLGEGSQSFTAIDTDKAGNVSQTSPVFTAIVETFSRGAPASIGVNMEGAEYSWVGYPTLADLENVKSEGVDLVRLPIAWEMMQPTLDGPLNSTYLAGLESFLNNAASLGIGVIVDLQNYGTYNLNWAADAAASGGNEAPNGPDASKLGSAAVPISAFANFWQQLAAALNGNPGVAGYDIMNEPNNMPTPETWPDAAQAAVNAIRSVDMNTPIVVEGDSWASAQNWPYFNENLNITDHANDIIYEAHQYFDNGSGLYQQTYAQLGDTSETGVQLVAPFIQWLKNNNYSGYLGELGIPSNDPQWIPLLNKVLNDLQANGVSGTVFDYETPDSSPAWWATLIDNNTYNLDIAPVNGVITPAMALIFEHSAPVIESYTPGIETDSFVLSGAAAGDSVVSVFDQGQLLGTTTASINGAWNFTTAALSIGTQVFTASAADSSGDVSEVSAALSVAISGRPSITSFSPDSGQVGDGITNATRLTLTGTGEANSTVQVYDGAALLGAVSVNASGAWSFATATLAPGTHAFTAVDIEIGGNASQASPAMVVTVDTTPPAAPVIVSDRNTGVNQVTLHGTAEANSTISVFDDATLLGTASVSASGAWSFTTPSLTAGTQTFTATDTDSAGNVSVASQPIDPTIGAITVAQAASDTTAPVEVLDTAADISAAFTALNGDGYVNKIVVSDSGSNEVTITAAQAASDTTALGELYQANGATAAQVAVSDTAADVSANFDALNADAHIASITLTGGGAPKMTLTAAQVLDDTALLGKFVGSYTIAIADTAADIAADFDALNSHAHVTSITLTDNGTLTLTAAQGLHDTTALGAITNASYAIAIADSAENISANFSALNADARVTSITLTGSGALTLTVAQAVDDTAALGDITNIGHAISIVDTAADIEALTTGEIASLASLHVSSVEASDASLAVSAAQAAAFESAHIVLRARVGDSVAVSDTTAHLEALTAAQIVALKGAEIATLVSNNGAAAFSVAQAVALESAGVTVSAPGARVTLSDSAANLETLTTGEIAGLPAAGFTGAASTSASVAFTVAQALAFEAIGFRIATPSGGGVTISDTAANVKALTTSEIGGLPAVGVSAIDATGARVTLSLARALALEVAGMPLSVPSGAVVVHAHVAANLETLTTDEIAGLSRLHVTKIKATDAGATLSVAQALALETGRISLSAPSGDSVAIVDTAADIEALTTGEIASLASLHVSSVEASVASLTVSAAQAAAFGSAHIALSAPAADSVAVFDTAAHLEALTATQIAALPATGVDDLFSTNANVSYTAAQTAAILSSGLGVTAAGSDTVTENFSNGNYSVYQGGALIQQKLVNPDGDYDIAYFDVSGLGYSSYEDIYNTAGAKVAEAEDVTKGSGMLSLCANDLTISSSSGQLSVTIGSDPFAVDPHSVDTIIASGTTQDVFVYRSGFGEDAMTGFLATGADHDLLQFNASSFSYLTPGESQAADFAAVLSHATQTAGDNTVIADSFGDSLTLNGVTLGRLAANAADFKFV